MRKRKNPIATNRSMTPQQRARFAAGAAAARRAHTRWLTRPGAPLPFAPGEDHWYDAGWDAAWARLSHGQGGVHPGFREARVNPRVNPKGYQFFVCEVDDTTKQIVRVLTGNEYREDAQEAKLDQPRPPAGHSLRVYSKAKVEREGGIPRGMRGLGRRSNPQGSAAFPEGAASHRLTKKLREKLQAALAVYPEKRQGDHAVMVQALNWPGGFTVKKLVWLDQLASKYTRAKAPRSNPQVDYSSVDARIEEANKLARAYNSTLKRALKAHGERGPWISAVAQDHFPESVKEKLRKTVFAFHAAQDAVNAAWHSLHPRTDFYRSAKAAPFRARMVRAGNYGTGTAR